MKIKNIFTIALLSLSVSACSSLSQVDVEGKTDQPVFPDKEKVTFSKGSFPNLENLKQVQAGVTRDQLYNLIGRPHFAEGFKVREWDYLFQFRTAEGIKTCQFKILFDQDRIAQSFYWQPEECSAFLEEPAAVEQPTTFVLSGDVGFAFGSATINAAGHSFLAQTADQIQQRLASAPIQVIGHTDRIGNEQSNLLLSQQRADAVRKALISYGVAAQNISAKGAGSSKPIAFCEQTIDSDLIKCLAPNRRVEITEQGR